MYSQIVKFEDSLGVISQFDLNWVDSLEVRLSKIQSWGNPDTGLVQCTQTLHEHLLIRFRSLQGAEMVRNKQYILNDAFTGGRLDIGDREARLFQPGQCVQMSMCFNVRKQIRGACPRCSNDITEVNTGELIWYIGAQDLEGF